MSDPNCLHCVMWEAFEKFVMGRDQLNPAHMGAEALQVAAEVVAITCPNREFDRIRTVAIDKFTLELDKAIAEIKACGQFRPGRSH